MTTNQKGAIAETAVAHAATKLGIDVYRPVAEGGRYDLIFGLDSRLIRIQCKWAARRGDVVQVPCVSCRRGRDGFVRRSYTADEVDAIVAYCQALDQCYFIPIERVHGSPAISLRVAPTRNNQQLKINWAKDFEFEATLRFYGAVAQLGER